MRLALIFALTLSCQVALAGSTHPFSVRDMQAMDRLSEPVVSPDGKLVVFTVRTTDLEENKGHKDLFLARVDGSEVRRLTSHTAEDYGARWMPDSKSILFISSRSGASQVWRIGTDAGEATRVTTQPLDVDNLVLSRDGKYMAFSMEVFPDTDPERTKELADQAAKKKATGKIFDQIFVRHWDSWADGHRSHLFVMPASGEGKAVDVMKKMNADVPSKPFGGTEEYTFTPDGKEIVFSTRDVGVAEPWSTNFDLYRAPIDGSKAPESLTAKNLAWDTQPAFSPDGKTLAYLAMKRPGYESDRFQIVLRNWADGTEKFFAQSWDRSPSDIRWSADGQKLIVTAYNLGQHALFALDVKTEKATTLVETGHITAPEPGDKQLVYLSDTIKAPAEVWVANPDGSGAHAITHVNDDRIAAARMGDFEQFSFNGANDEKVYGFILKPIDFDPAKKYPVAYIIHGGPQGSSANTFHYRWNPEAFSGAGYGVVMIDFHGSTGYGQAFTDSIRDDWGGKPLEDLKRGLKAALEKNPWMDGDRVGALGASYGGYMINWIAGNWNDGFRCLVNHDGIFDERAGGLDTEELWFPEWEHNGTPWENPASYEKFNPCLFVKNWKTPMLVIHGGKDFRIPDTHALSAFNALQRRGIPSKLLYFPDENHWVLKPQNSILWYDTVLAWMERWLKAH
jgi:dipeptidyl aminopeptidase/acylaminoacyl peptidase